MGKKRERESGDGAEVKHTQEVSMPRYYCDYCDAYLTHDSRSVRKQHCSGFKHKANVRAYYAVFLEQLQVHERKIQEQQYEQQSRQAFQASLQPQFQAFRPPNMMMCQPVGVGQPPPHMFPRQQQHMRGPPPQGGGQGMPPPRGM